MLCDFRVRDPHRYGFDQRLLKGRSMHVLQARVVNDPLFEEPDSRPIVAIAAGPSVQIKWTMSEVGNDEQMAILEL